jgi:hypothetical protein
MLEPTELLFTADLAGPQEAVRFFGVNLAYESSY